MMPNDMCLKNFARAFRRHATSIAGVDEDIYAITAYTMTFK
jgi:hypothetical protein